MSYRVFKKNLIQDFKAKTISFFFKKNLQIVSTNYIIKFLEEYADYYKKDVRVCLHPNKKSPFHIMVILQHKFNIYLPHKHTKSSDKIFVCKGSILVKIFTSKGVLKESFIAKKNDYVLMKDNEYHSFNPITNRVVFIESKRGPFNKHETIFPKWSHAN